MNSAEDSFSNIWSGLVASHKTQILIFQEVCIVIPIYS